MKRGTVVGINDDPAWAQVSEFDDDRVAYHWAELLTIDLPGVVGEGGVSPAVCVERVDQVTADEQQMVVGDYTATLDLQAAVCRLSGPDDLDAIAAAFRSAGDRLRAFIAAEDVTSITTPTPCAKSMGA
ncbi:hypothetical protein Csp2054_09010 [Curtobacterium sp. 'Ferrero']|uniref:hypothetical protein n=1 Tax=Curtobacterium sp. 'Ferrero' TaxID=2033654 RepID=UPI000BD712A9|nr:hypothetical protein [Curtobacterium sp. 'Ferrero']PCN48002.1 hypothetical protein Csp2054_09010 [Curtobacterium sp. 'Ferrero']